MPFFILNEKICGFLEWKGPVAVQVAPGPSSRPIWPLPASMPSTFGMNLETSKLRPFLSIEALWILPPGMHTIV